VSEESYGERMRRLRLALGLSQPEVARLAGCSVMAISLWERGKRQGNSTEAAALPRRIIQLLEKRLKRRLARVALDADGLARSQLPNGVAREPLVPPPEKRRRGRPKKVQA